MDKLVVRRIGVLVKPNHPEALKTVCRLAEWCAARGLALVGGPRLDRESIEAETGCSVETLEHAELVRAVDLIVVLGGDGTMIASARMVGDAGTPVLGVNFGTLGYIAEFTIENMIASLDSVLAGDYTLDRRLMLAAEVFRGGEKLMHDRVLNDVVISKSALARIIEIETWVDKKFVNLFRADGLIVSTPTGSTAYNLSAGGPVIYPSMNAVVVTPICPHTLSNRPLVVEDTVEFEMILKTSKEEVALTLDGQVGIPLEYEDRVCVRKSRTTFNLVQARTRNYFDVLRNKLKWGR
ncbi:MAG TPA: NAD(+)/NADH kinase [Pyrinomonadaceae bacterium]|nr:NAD(+)/NADH kinase [Pyrinomonadaceae bacterium]